MSFERPKRKPETAVKARMRRVFERITVGKDGDKPVSMGEALRAEGYAPTTANNPQAIVATRTWQELMEEYIPEEKLAKKHSQLLEAGEHQTLTFHPRLTDEKIKEIIEAVDGCHLVHIEEVKRTIQGKRAKNEDEEDEPDEEITVGKIAFFRAPDNRIQLEALDRGYKLKGSYAAEKHTNVNVQFSLADLRKMRDAGTI